MGIQGMHQRRPFLNDPDPRVAVTVDPPLVALRQAKPTLQVEIILVGKRCTMSQATRKKLKVSKKPVSETQTLANIKNSIKSEGLSNDQVRSS